MPLRNLIGNKVAVGSCRPAVARKSIGK